MLAKNPSRGELDYVHRRAGVVEKWDTKEGRSKRYQAETLGTSYTTAPRGSRGNRLVDHRQIWRANTETYKRWVCQCSLHQEQARETKQGEIGY
jgi:hypothetical protein